MNKHGKLLLQARVRSFLRHVFTFFKARHSRVSVLFCDWIVIDYKSYYFIKGHFTKYLKVEVFL